MERRLVLVDDEHTMLTSFEHALTIYCAMRAVRVERRYAVTLSGDEEIQTHSAPSESSRNAHDAHVMVPRAIRAEFRADLVLIANAETAKVQTLIAII